MALGTVQLNCTISPSSGVAEEVVNVIGAAGMLETTSVPVPAGSSIDLSVSGLVLLVVSAVEFQTAASEVKSAAPLDPLGAAGGLMGQDP